MTGSDLRSEEKAGDESPCYLLCITVEKIMRFIWLFVLVILVSCKTVPTQEQLVMQKKHIDEYHEFMELLENYKVAREKKYAEPTSLEVWIEMVRNKFNENFEPSDSMIGHEVKTRVALDDDGFVKSTSVVSSSGHPELFNAASDAIRNSAPFPVSGLSEKNRRVAQNVTLVFAP
ncbi:hypothetical protein CAG70_04080 [Photobacterium halotolerans]|uniref:cell envelope integrity protein TolA n=1 Tax=Photobacterium halotolerans TaxID=265726 RepID=UPI001372EB55|nr:cell envelope integrity protein TolA [Photobacterium halotolerans]NAX46180.1 hypothetical protein [Photobacterium halotolerans]